MDILHRTWGNLKDRGIKAARTGGDFGSETEEEGVSEEEEKDYDATVAGAL
jgi:hypothetical protein